MEVDDLVQEALLRAWQDKARWPAWEPGDGGLTRWLAVIVRHATIDAARASRAKKRDGREQHLERSDYSRGGDLRDLPAETAGPSTRAGWREARGELERAFQRLSGEHRRVLALRQFEGRSAAETALVLGRSETAVHSSFRRALQSWERELGHAFPESRDESGVAPRSSPA